MADGQQTDGTLIERVLQRHRHYPDRSREGCLPPENQPGADEKPISFQPCEAQLAVDRRGWLVTLMGVSWYLLHGAPPAHGQASGTPEEKQIKKVLIERLLNRRIDPNTQELVPETTAAPSRLIWNHDDHDELAIDRKAWFAEFIDNGKKALRKPIIADTTRNIYAHAEAPDDEQLIGGLLTDIRQAADQASKEGTFLEVYDKMHDLVGNIVAKEKQDLIVMADGVISKAYKDGYRQGWATCNPTPPSETAVDAAWAAYQALPPSTDDSIPGIRQGWPPMPSAHFTY